MVSTVPQAMRRSGGLNRWTMEPLFSLVYILVVASGVLAITLTAEGVAARYAAVTLIVLWTVAAVLWVRKRASRHSH